jgi:hypothetical protein
MGGDELFRKRKLELRRLQNTRKPRKILIVCEGEKTEPHYFKRFPINPDVYDKIDIYGTGYNTVSLIEEALRLKNEAIRKKEPYIEIWCVFDKDDFSIDAFSKAIHLADRNQIKCAYSIEAFELWYMLHFNYYDTALSRRQYMEKLTELLQKPYTKNDTGIYKLLEKRQARAIRNAQKLYLSKYSLPLKEQNPVTLVFNLVKRLTE